MDGIANAGPRPVPQRPHPSAEQGLDARERMSEPRPTLLGETEASGSARRRALARGRLRENSLARARRRGAEGPRAGRGNSTLCGSRVVGS